VGIGFKNRKYEIDESEYFSAFVVSPANASNLQTLIDTHGSVRLESGDYSASGNITLSSGQSLYGYILPSILGGSITIEAGSTNVLIKSIDATDIIFEAGSEISYCYLANIKFTAIKTLSGRINNCTLFNFDRCTLEFDCGASGYVRNTPMIRITSQSSSNQTVFYGNDTEPSYGNSEIMRVFLTSGGDTAKYDNLQDHRIVSSDCESWNFNNTGTDGAIYARNIGDFIMSNIHGGNNTSYDTLPFLDIEADNLVLYNSIIEDNVSNPSYVRADTNFIHLYSRDHLPTIDTPTTGQHLQGMHEIENELLLDNTDRASALSGADETFVNTILDIEPYKEVGFDNLTYIKSPTGIDWKDYRTGQTDERAAIQTLIDNDDIAELEGRVYYIGGTLNISDGQGIIGQGISKTVIVGITDDFPLIEEIKDMSVSGGTSSYYFSNLTLQGGNAGMHFAHTGTNNFQINYSTFENISFRDQNYGIHLDQFYGFDNVSFNNVNFFNCTIGFYQQPDYTPAAGETDYIMYVDKVLFNECLFQDCDTGVSMLANRANNLNTWINCTFHKNVISLDLNANNHSSFVSCQFSNTTGGYVIDGRNNNMVSFYGCNFTGNSTDTTFNIKKVYLEDCTSSDTFDLLEVDNSSDEQQVLISNSILSNSLGDVNDGLVINSTTGVASNTTIITSQITKISNLP